MRIVSNLLILCFSILNLIIRCRTFYHEGYFLDETGLSTIELYGTNFLAKAQWFSLLFNFLISFLAVYNLYSHLYSLYKDKKRINHK